ncbi:dipeptidyl aminopeptidase/acylaminoacyl peptidase [Lysobacter niabensis]|uniref:Dipeptidyl aminopeptidase/acylaminoacyl peptidase n=1 Tax=Agrilutibacter niabensis TaxID=380628 RepID=A0ABU1VRK6_9GAMM|nr:S9 family peptidase [Lysobacter niabensis]MDR7100114.1 dipeptidyl aminopeptidase/acylaminoacyl peptidase [Lysobacter niabensis]
MRLRLMAAAGSVCALLATASAAAVPSAPPAPPVPFGVDDLARLADVAAPDLSADGKALVYSVSTVNAKEDLAQTDLWRVGYDGTGRVQLTRTPTHSESRPLWSPDGRAIAFLSDAPPPAKAKPGKSGGGEEEEVSQVWLMPAAGGPARPITRFPSGVDDYVWSPDGKRIAVIVRDSERPAGAAKPKHPPPIVSERYQFKEDGTGYLGERRTHLYVVDIASGKAEQITTGKHDEILPSWSPDGKLVAYVTKRGVDPDRHLNYDIYVVEPKAGASERQLTTFPGSDLDPYWETRPAWSPDSTRIAYLRSGEDKWIYYAPWQLAVVDVASGHETVPAPIDRCFTKPHWSADGRGVFVLVEQSGVTHLSRVELDNGRVTELTHGDRFDYDLAVSRNDRVVVLGDGDLHPYRISAVEGDGLRVLADHNEFLATRALAAVETIRFRNRDGGEIEGLLVKPHGYAPGRRYPTIVRLHGGPVYQFSHEFMPDWQVYAAQGFAVLAINPRGSSGRGFDFARAIYADWGSVDVRDVLDGIEHVVALGIADPQRLGVGGWSYGAILTNAVIASDTRFKAAISGAGASNMYGMYGHDQYIREYELELGTPWANRDVYDRASFPFLHADRITTPTMFQCAGEDVNVPCLGAEQMYQALRSRNVPTRLVVYPGESHGLTVPSYLRDRMARNLAWYQRFLQEVP